MIVGRAAGRHRGGLRRRPCDGPRDRFGGVPAPDRVGADRSASCSRSLAAIGAVAASSRGLTGEISHAWHELTSPNSVVSATAAGRVLQFGSSRPVYWHQALQVGDHHLFKGVGLLGFGVARLRYTTERRA